MCAKWNRTPPQTACADISLFTDQTNRKFVGSCADKAICYLSGLLIEIHFFPFRIWIQPPSPHPSFVYLENPCRAQKRFNDRRSLNAVLQLLPPNSKKTKINSLDKPHVRIYMTLLTGIAGWHIDWSTIYLSCSIHYQLLKVLVSSAEKKWVWNYVLRIRCTHCHVTCSFDSNA